MSTKVRQKLSQLLFSWTSMIKILMLLIQSKPLFSRPQPVHRNNIWRLHYDGKAPISRRQQHLREDLFYLFAQNFFFLNDWVIFVTVVFLKFCIVIWYKTDICLWCWWYMCYGVGINKMDINICKLSSWCCLLSNYMEEAAVVKLTKIYKIALLIYWMVAGSQVSVPFSVTQQSAAVFQSFSYCRILNICKVRHLHQNRLQNTQWYGTRSGEKKCSLQMIKYYILIQCASLRAIQLALCTLCGRLVANFAFIVLLQFGSLLDMVKRLSKNESCWCLWHNVVNSCNVRKSFSLLPSRKASAAQYKLYLRQFPSYFY